MSQGSGHDERKPHVVLDLPSRAHKGEKIARLLEVAEGGGPFRLLEVGTGSGGIAHYFASIPGGRFSVDAIDVVDNRLVRDGYRYQTVESTILPFETASFDFVLSNHVIEHVGPVEEQRKHLSELRRVLKPGGKGYLAVPNRWMVVEPHYRLPFLSWLPESMRSAYLRASGKGSVYDCKPLNPGEAKSLLLEAGFRPMQHCGDAVRITFELEHPGPGLGKSVALAIPDRFYRLLAPVFPTLIYTLDPV